MDGVLDPYRVLQVDREALPTVIQAAYQALARLYHPDGSSPNPIRMSNLNRAFELLSDPERRRRFDLDRSIDRPTAIPIVNTPETADRVPPLRDASSPSDGPVLDFGRYAGWRISDLARHDADYLRWLARHSAGIRFREVIARLLPDEPDLARRSKSLA